MNELTENQWKFQKASSWAVLHNRNPSQKKPLTRKAHLKMCVYVIKLLH